MSTRLKINIPEKYKLDYIILVLAFLHVMVFKFFNLNRYSNLLLVCMILLRFLASSVSKKSKVVLSCIGFIFLVFICALVSYMNGRYSYIGIFKVNIQTLLYTMIIASYFVYMMKTNAIFIDNFLSTWTGILNVYYILNMFLMIVQVMVPGFMAGVAVADANSYAPDLITGFFGYSSTHNLTFFTIFMFLLNIYAMEKCDSKIKRFHYRNLLIVYLIYTLVISIFNDNKSIYLLLIVFFVTYKDISEKWLKVNKIFAKRFGIIIVTCVIVICMYSYVMTSDSVVLEPIRNIIQMVLDSMTATQRNDQIVAGGSERIFLISYAFKYYNGFSYGYGLGAFGWDKSTALGFYHFGLSDLGTYLVLGGLVLTIPLFLFYWYSYGQICFYDRDKYLPGRLEILMLILIVAFYSTAFRDTTLQFCVLLCFICIGLSARRKARLL